MRLIEGLVIKFDWLVPLLQALLEFLNFELEFLLFILMLGFQCKDLIIGLPGMLAPLKRVLIDDDGLFLNLRNLSMHLYNAVLGKTMEFHELQK